MYTALALKPAVIALSRICALTAWIIKQGLLCLKCGKVMPTEIARSMQLTKPFALLRQFITMG